MAEIHVTVVNPFNIARRPNSNVVPALRCVDVGVIHMKVFLHV